MAGFARGVNGAGGRHNRPGAQRAKISDHKLRAVRQHQRHAVSFLHAQRLQAGSAAIHMIQQLGVADAVAEINQGRLPGKFFRCLFQHLGQGNLWVSHRALSD